ncbi:MAG: amidohydrolase family protein, partial [Clostridia bacterium]
MIAFINANLIDGKENSDLQKLATVLVEGDKIAGVLESGAKLPDKCKVIDLDGDYMLPGFINLHAHLFGTGKPSKALGGGKLQEFLVKIVNSKCGHFIADALVKSSAKKQLLSGVTTVRGVGDFCYSDVRVRDKINKGKVVGARLIVSGPALTCVGGHGDGTFGIGCDDIDKLVELTDNNIANRVDLIKICVTGGVMDAKRRGEPGEVKMTLAQTKAICDEAHNLGYKVASHTESEKGIEVALAGGVDTIEHGSKISEQLVESFIEHKATLTATFSPAVPLASLPSEVTLMNET